MGDVLHHFAGHRWLNVQPRSAYLSEWPFTLFVWFLFFPVPLCLPISLLLSHAIPFSLPQSSTWPISVRLLSCTILCVLASRALAIPQSPSCQLLYPLFHPSPPLSFCMLSKPSTSVSNALSSGTLPFCLCSSVLFLYI